MSNLVFAFLFYIVPFIENTILSNLKFSIDSVKINEMTYVYLKFENTGDPVQISTPVCWYNCRPTLIRDSKVRDFETLVKVDPSCKRQFYWVTREKPLKLRYEYSLEFLYDSLERGDTVSFTYRGEIKDHAGKKIVYDSIVSNCMLTR